MNQQVNVYYMYYPKESHTAGTYHKYQQKLADKILNYGLINMFDIDGTRKIIEKGKYGKPYLKGMEQYQYNISNTDGMVVCAVSDGYVGIDVEKKKDFHQRILRKCASSLETAYILETEDRKLQAERFFRLWTLKESYIKMTGEGMRIPLKEVEFQISEKGTKTDVRENAQIRCSREGKFYQKEQGEYWITLCAREEATVRWIPVVLNEISEIQQIC